MKSSKHVETCFVRANNDFDDKLTAFWMKKKNWTKIPKNGHCADVDLTKKIWWKSAVFNSINLPFDAQVAAKILNVIY